MRYAHSAQRFNHLTLSTVAPSFRVTVAKDYLNFAAAHFITMRGHKCEALHGHNYRVGVTVEGALDAECRWVMDFSVLKEILRPLVKSVDHRVLLPTRNPKLTLEPQDGRVHVAVFGEPRYVFPETDCVLLELENTTAELLAEHFGLQVKTALAEQGYADLTRLVIEVEESTGQSAFWEWR
jgi:6-pyruvoyltetrahydropterin/6-carboxytetrahydropterin synthase